jgi:putative FmdB family regulatory protein
MPIYTYRCSSCGVQFDRQQHFEDPHLVKCPECGKRSLKKIYTPAGIIFKGSGWYSTDHRSPSGQTPSRSKNGTAGGEAKSEPAKESGTEISKEAKPRTTEEGS